MESLVRSERNREYPTFAATVICGSFHVDGLVRNLTAGGAMFESRLQLRAGSKIILDIGGLSRIPSTVVWSIDTRAGVRFDEPHR